METPGARVSLRGDTPGRTAAKRVSNHRRRIESGAEVREADVRLAISAARAGEAGSGVGGSTLPLGRRGPINAKTAAQAAYLEMLSSCELVFGVGPAGTGKTFLAVAHGASMLLRGEGLTGWSSPVRRVEAGERLGFLLGDLTEKVDPYMALVWEALSDILGADRCAADATRARSRWP